MVVGSALEVVLELVEVAVVVEVVLVVEVVELVVVETAVGE